MATSLSGGSIGINLVATLVKALTLSTPSDQQQVQTSWSLQNGTGAGKANMSYGATRTLAASTNETLILNGDATFKNSFGDAISFTKIKAIIIRNNGIGALTVGGGTNPVPLTNGTTDAINVPANTMLVLACNATGLGWTVTASTACNLKIAADGTTGGVTYDVLVIGEA
jgi:hypothetical protein